MLVSVTNATRSICTVDIGDTVKIECPVTSSCICSWERNGQSVCSGSVCTLTDIEVDDLGLYSCGVQELILIPGIMLEYISEVARMQY